MDKYLIFATSIVVVIVSLFTACDKVQHAEQQNVTEYETTSQVTTVESTTTETTTPITRVYLKDKDRISAEFMPMETITISNYLEETSTTMETSQFTETTSESQETEQYYTGLSSTEFDMVCAVVQAEADSGSIQFKEYIAGIIYNRIQSEYFPNTVYGVLTQENQFGSISNYYYNTYPVDDDTRLAVSRIFSGYDTYILYNLNDAVSYCNPNLVSSSTLNWFETSLRFTYQCTEYIDGITWVHRFYALP